MFLNLSNRASRDLCHQASAETRRSWPKIVIPSGELLKSVLLMAAVCLVVAIAVGQTQAPVPPARVAIINAQKAVADTQEMKKVTASLQAKYQPRQQAVQNLQRELQNIEQQLNSSTITPDRQAQLRAEGTQKQKQLQRMNEDLQADFNDDRQDVLGKAGRQMQQVLSKMAQERGFDVVVDISSTLYYKPALDITAEATAAYDRAYPAH